MRIIIICSCHRPLLFIASRPMAQAASEIWYYIAELGKEGWLFFVLFKHF